MEMGNLFGKPKQREAKSGHAPTEPSADVPVHVPAAHVAEELPAAENVPPSAPVVAKIPRGIVAHANAVGPNVVCAEDAAARVAFAACCALADATWAPGPPNVVHRGTWLLRSGHFWFWNAPAVARGSAAGGQDDLAILHRSRRLGVKLIHGSNGWISVTTRDGMEHTWYSGDSVPASVDRKSRGNRVVAGIVDTDEAANDDDAAARPLPEGFVPVDAASAAQLRWEPRGRKACFEKIALVSPVDFTIWIGEVKETKRVIFSPVGIHRNRGHVTPALVAGVRDDSEPGSPQGVAELAAAQQWRNELRSARADGTDAAVAYAYSPPKPGTP